ncbi:M15 family metallopeptidase [Bifidobacterium amazonense]|uniref:M15 family metallopeptidase n=1 Tax=Bifidobacterium amazonense TaxID=2809027 RepID=A0ABS9VV90_9BIFI|nr:M15 family metallopeptidase [Bifidobacterium amazonense]MCH9276033.1 M15 family metallopeptidase [Bifidobacterium amazonense]
MAARIATDGVPTASAARGAVRAGTVRSFARYRRQRAAKTLVRLTAALLAAIAVVAGLLFGLGRLAHWGPFTPGIPEATYSADSWNTIVVNQWQRIPDDWPAPDLTQLANGQQIDSRAYPDLQRMFDAMRADGLNPEVTAGYRTHDEQQQLLDDKIFLYENNGMDAKDAEAKARLQVALPGTSEHELGVAADINAVGASDADANQRVYDWLATNAWEYGFILRYPAGKTSVTGVEHEPWHYRFVGAEAAKAIHESGIALEEYQP